MKKNILFIFCFFILLENAQGSDWVGAITENGEEVRLLPDGTWTYKQQIQEFKKALNSTKVLKSKKGFYELWYNPKKWTTKTETVNSDAEFSLKHVTGDAYAMIIAERIEVPISTLKDIVLEKAKEVAPDSEIIFEKELIVNGSKFLNLHIKGTAQGISFIYDGYYWSGEKGTLQVVTFTGQNLFNEFEHDLIDFLNGVVINE